jgi:catechol 2,3-dioxygenase-like lactoylglutathione lyase family enzyme
VNRLFDHVEIRVSDRQASELFYSTVLQTLGVEQTDSEDWMAGWDDFSLWTASDDKPVTRRLHLAFAAPSRDHVNEFWRAGTQAGYRDDGAPGERRQYSSDYYGAFLLDPEGNSAEAVHRSGMRTTGNLDHLWIRVADVAAARRFYATIAPYAGLRIGADTPERAQFRGEPGRGGGSFSLVPGTPTEHVHLAFPASENATVDDFHRAATEAGYRDNGSPGERPEYHPGYYGAFVCDPDGNNIEVVSHNRR